VGASPHGRLTALLNCHSFYSFGAGVSSPSSLVRRAASLGYRYLCLTDELGVHGAVELVKAARDHGVTPLIGATVPLEHQGRTYPLVLLAASRAGYQALNELITLTRSREEKSVPPSVLAGFARDVHCLTGGRRGYLTELLAQRRLKDAEDVTTALKNAFHQRLWVQLYFDAFPHDQRRMRVLRRFAREQRLPVAFAPEVRYATPEDYPLYDTLVCARLGITVETPHRQRPQNDAQAIQPHYPVAFPDAIANAERLARELTWELLPDRMVTAAPKLPAGTSAQAHLEERCYAALVEKYQGEGLSAAKARLEQELATLRALRMHEFFLIATEVMDFCRSRGILASGRGSAAGSVVCYLLGVTRVDPIAHELLFERFLHAGRQATPDIDIDIASHRREEVFAWLVERFGLERAAMVCNRVTYYLPSAIKDVARALGLPFALANRLSKALGRDYRDLRPHQARQAQAAFDEVLGDAPVKDVLLNLLCRIERGFVRQIAPHSGGWVLARESLAHYSPTEVSSGGLNTIQFDKDHAEALGLMKLDLLSLRILGCLERARELAFETEGVWLELEDLPDDPQVWRGIQAGDTLALFQLESPAQVRMSVLFKPRSKRDLKIQVALVRPGPIQSGSVDPLVARASGHASVSYLHPSLEPILKKTYGVLLYQEDLMRIAVHVAGFSWEEADRFRKLVTTFEDESEIRDEYERFIAGCERVSGMNRETAKRLFETCSAFRGYGFAESHAAAFAEHAYASAWLRHHYPAEFLAAFMTEHPGMWSVTTLRQEARRLGVGFARLDINTAGVTYGVEREDGNKRLRPPLTSVEGVSEKVAREIVLERLKRGPFRSVRELFERLRVDRDVLEALARAGAFDRLEGRREAIYRIGTLASVHPPARATLFSNAQEEDAPPFPPLATMERLAWDVEVVGYSAHPVHPVDLVRARALALGATPMARLPRFGHVTTAGLVAARQRPPTAKGFAFYVLEDGIHRIQAIISPTVWNEHRVTLRDARFLLVEGVLTTEANARTLKAESIAPLDARCR
jgi:error-prone DNA polymerase